MPGFDALAGGWSAKCELADQEVRIELADFRQVCPWDHQVHQVDFCCPLCLQSHTMLRTQAQLDLEPLSESWNSHFDLAKRQTDWRGYMLQEAWAAALSEGRWPLMWRCPRTQQLQWGRPSLLRQINPLPQAYLVQYQCDCCSASGIAQWSAAQWKFQP